MPTPEEFAREGLLYNGARGKRCDMDGKPEGAIRGNESINVQHLQSAQLDRVGRVCISTIQRLYSMLRSLLFWIETPVPEGQITRGDRQRVVRVQRSVWTASTSLLPI